MRCKVALIAALFLPALLLAAGAASGAPGPVEKETDQFLKTFTEVLATVQDNYAREVPAGTLVESGIRGLLRTLDPHSSFFTRSDYSRLQEEQRGRYYGLGISIRAASPGSGRVVVVEPPALGTPAYKVGLKTGDVISKIEGEPIDDWDLNEQVIPNLKGPKGTAVTITVERPGDPEPFDLKVVRDEIPLYTIRHAFHIRPDIGYIHINKFSEATSQELNEALERLGEAELEGLILDLRDNPGGPLGQAIAVADRFLDKDDVIVSTRDRQGRGREFKAPRGNRHSYPMTVLINQNSASASEIVAGALQDHDRALIVGETSFGKALVQTIYPLRGNRGLALTTGKYLTPSDRLIQRDYSDSFYDYYMGRAPSAGPQKAFRTDGGRTVYGGGGITPDEQVKLNTYSKLAVRVQRKNLVSRFIDSLTSGGVVSDRPYQFTPSQVSDLPEEQRDRLLRKLEITDRTTELFREFIGREGMKFDDAEFEESRTLITNRLKQELFLALFGDREAYRVSLEVDNQVQRAIELLPQVGLLLRNDVARK